MGVDGGGRLDQHQDRRVDGEGAREHDPLPLAAREPASALVELALPALGQRVVDVLGVGHPQRGLGLLAGQPAVRVDGVLERPGEQAAAGVADQHLTAYVVEAGGRQVDAAEADAPLLGRGRLVAGGDAPAPALAVGAGQAGGAALEALAVVLAHGVGVRREVAAEAVGQRGALLGHGAHDDRQLPGVGGEAAEVVDDLATSRRAAGGRPGSRHGGTCSKIAMARRALTSARVDFWASSKKVRIGPTMNRP